MKRRSKLVVALVTALLAMIAATSAGAGRGAAHGTVTLAFIPPVIKNPAIQAMNGGFKNQSKKLGMTALTVGGEFNPQAQITAVDAAIQRHVDAIIIWPLDPKGIRPTLDKARKAGIELFTIWTPGFPGATADFRYAETSAAEQIAALAAAEAKKNGKPCKVGIIQGLPIVAILKARNDNLEAGAKKAGCTVLERQVNQKDSADGAQPIVAAWKTKWGSQMSVILAYNDPSALGAVAASVGDFKPVIVGMNGDPAALDAIKSGTMLATTTIPNPEVGNAFAYAAYITRVKHQKVPSELSGHVDVITKANIDKYIPWDVRNKQPLAVSFVQQGGQWIIKTTPDFSIVK